MTPRNLSDSSMVAEDLGVAFIMAGGSGVAAILTVDTGSGVAAILTADTSPSNSLCNGHSKYLLMFCCACMASRRTYTAGSLNAKVFYNEVTVPAR